MSGVFCVGPSLAGCLLFACHKRCEVSKCADVLYAQSARGVGTTRFIKKNCLSPPQIPLFILLFFAFSQELVKNVLVPAMTEIKNIPADTLQFGKSKVSPALLVLLGGGGGGDEQRLTCPLIHVVLWYTYVHVAPRVFTCMSKLRACQAEVM